MEIEVKVKVISPLVGTKIKLPEYATDGSAGLDLRACINSPITLAKGDSILIPTGIGIQLPSAHMAGFVFARSGLASKHGINLANGVGVIDSDYTGEIICPLQNVGKQSHTINPGDRIAQIVFMPIARARLVLVEQLVATKRGEGGFGSSGLD